MNSWPSRVKIMAAVVVACVVLVVYYPAVQIGFFWDDYIHLDAVARMEPTDYLIEFFKPVASWHPFRPLEGVQFLTEYTLFGSNPTGYHLAHFLFHAINCVLLLLIVLELNVSTRLAFLCGLIFATLPIYAEAVFWPADPTPLMAIFYFLAILFWIKYLRNGKTNHLIVAFVSAALAMLTKEVAVTLVAVLFLLDRSLFNRESKVRVTLAQYGVLVSMVGLIAILVYLFRSESKAFVSNYAFDLSTNFWANTVSSLGLLVVPWSVARWANLLLIVALSLYAFRLLFKRDRVWLGLGLFAVLNFLPYVGFQGDAFMPRYLYVSGAVPAVFVAALGEWMLAKLPIPSWRPGLVAGAGALLLLVGGVEIGEKAEWQSRLALPRRVPFRDISQSHASFLSGTRAYFIAPQHVTIQELSGMFALRYKRNVTVKSTDYIERAELGSHTSSYVFYFDDENRVREQRVAGTVNLQIEPALPAAFDAPFKLVGYEIAQDRLKRGQALVLLLYWRSMGVVDKDYTVFVHLSNEKKEIVTAADSQPRAGGAPTSSWKPNQFIVDWSVIPIADEIPSGKYSLEIGMYYLPTMERLSFKDEKGLLKDTIVIQPIEILE